LPPRESMLPIKMNNIGAGGSDKLHHHFVLSRRLNSRASQELFEHILLNTSGGRNQCSRNSSGV
jgi:hypothetical protein